ncbi:MAG: bifunctional folylpolyglutamate synthase/dihydrofolate synthase [Oscillospiraceae bacterium]|nr:bifunctional folylpolyglutamate synthase/dihydrofolate synthase [Oscillospiraceae bacterium]
MRSLMHALGDPQKGMHFVHVAGTNGKGSCSAMTESILRQAGYKTGLFTSPHLVRFNERIQVSGKEIPDDNLAEIMTKVVAANDSLEEKVNWFEIVTAAGLVWFRQQECDIVVLEVGVGGEYDGTNVIDVPDVAVLMNIGLDHMEQLGDTVEKIASTKAGIIKENGDVVIYCGKESVEKIFEARCSEKNAVLHKADFQSIVPVSEEVTLQRFHVGNYNDIELPLIGEHQRKNTAVVLSVIDVLKEKGFSICKEDVYKGLRTVVWPARMQILGRDPLFVLDGGHNPQCVEAVRAGLEKVRKPGQKLVFLSGVLKGKDASEMFRILSGVSRSFVLVAPNSYRAQSVDDLFEIIQQYDCEATMCRTLPKAIETAKSMAGSQGIVCCVGSLYLAGEVLVYFDEERAGRK